MRFQEIQEACWTGYRQAGMKKKGDRQVPNCVPVEEVKVGPEITGRDLLFKAAAMAMRDAGREGISLDYEQAIKQASKIYGIPYQPSELPKLLAQRQEIDRQLALLKQGKQVAKQRRKEKLAPTPAGAEEYWRTHALPTDRIKPAAKSLEEATDIFMDNAARDMMAVLSMMAVGFGYGIYVKIRNKLDRYQGYQIVAALEDKGVTMNRATYEKVKPVLDQFKQALKDNDGAEAKALAKRIEQMVVMGKLSAPEPQAADTAVASKERELQEDLKKWFKEKWVRFGPDGKIRGDCARGSEGEGKPKCLPQSKAHALGKKGRASAAAKKRREDPNPERRGAAKNVATKVSEMDKSQPSQERHGDYPLGAKGTTVKPVKAKKVVKDLAKDLDNAFAFAKEKQVKEDDLDEACWKGYHKEGMKTMFGKRYPNCVKNKNESLEVYVNRGECPGCGGAMVSEDQINEKQDACYHKVKSRYKVWPSAYASGALVQCRKKGAANWGTGGKKK